MTEPFNRSGEANDSMLIEDAQVDLRAYLAARMLPLSVLLGVLVSFSAPLADYVLTLHGLRVEARTRAQELAAVIDREASERPILWQYDTPKILAHIQTNSTSQMERVQVLDTQGRALDLGSTRKTASDESLLWESAPIVIDGALAGHVWAGVRASQAQRDALLLLVPFGLLGLGLSGVVYWIPVRAMSRAESRIRRLIARIHDSQRALEAFNQTLEQQVQERASELHAANAQLRRKEEHIRTLSTRASALQEAERRAIARDLHDSAGQSLTAIRINLQLLAQVAENQEFVRTTAERTMKMTDETVEEIRRAVASLSPAILDDFGLEVAVSRLCDDFGERTGLVIDHQVTLGDSRCSPAVETAIYRIAQEALTNVNRHAKANSVQVHLTRKQDVLTLEVRDDGCGLDRVALAEATARPPEEGGHGIHGMRERCELLGGTLEILGPPEGGTLLRIGIPIS